MKDQHIDRFVGYLKTLVERDDRGALAALRRARSGNPRDIYATFQHIGRFLPPYPEGQDDYVLVASLYAWHPRASTRGNMGSHFAQLRSATPERGDSLERRFNGLLQSHPDELLTHLRAAIGLLKSAEIPVHWEQLLYDVSHWDHPDRFVQRAWATSFWVETRPEENSSSTT